MSIYDLRKSLEEADLKVVAPMIEFTDAIFCVDDRDILWYLPDNGGEVYSGWLPELYKSSEGYLYGNVDTQQGYWITMFFNLDNKISQEQFEHTYEEFM